MSAPGDIVILSVLLAAFLACAGYAAGRVHQRRQHGPEREQAYQQGYDSATRSVFSMAARAAGRLRTRDAAHGSAVVPPEEEPTRPVPPQTAGEERRGRHLVPDELVRAATYRLPPDRVARAKVRQPEEKGEPTVPYDPPVPRPR